MTLPKPYYEEPGITIYYGDCREILPHLPKVDLVLTDPPYGLDMGNPKNNKNGKYGIAGNEQHLISDWDKERISKETVSLILKSADIQIICGGNYFADYLPMSRGWAVWDKMNDDFYSTSDGELIWTSTNKALRFFRRPHGLDKGFMTKRNDVGNVHPTQKPFPLMVWLIQEYAGDAQTILDPFMGSGTTLRAAKDLGRKAIGIEIEPKYVEIAIKRLSQEVLPLEMPLNQPKPIVQATFL